MIINEQKQSLDSDLRELRVKIPADLYRKLHGVRILRGTPIRDIVEAALLEYFQHRSLTTHHDDADADADVATATE